MEIILGGVLLPHERLQRGLNESKWRGVMTLAAPSSHSKIAAPTVAASGLAATCICWHLLCVAKLWV